MDEDPDALAAAFFAAQAAKEEHKAKLPTEDWVNAISSLSAELTIAPTDDIASSVNNWLVTTMPSVPQSTSGGIELNTDMCSCNLLRKVDKQSETKCPTDEALHETGERIKQALVQKLLQEFNGKK